MRISAPDLSPTRAAFPSLARSIAGARCVFADAPGGTQVPERVVEAMAAYLRKDNANSGGAFPSSRATDDVIAAARRAGADLVGCGDDEIVFGPNMTTLAFTLSRSLGRELHHGHEVVVTRLDHDANIAPWVAAARDAGAEVRWVDIATEDCTLALDGLANVLSQRTRLVAFTLASNAVGTITAARDVVAAARSAGALIVADAVHIVPHRSIDARALGVDVLFYSPYKVFGPHLGVMYARRELLDAWSPYKVRPAHDESPERWETGTKSHEALAGFVASVDYLAELGRAFGDPAGEARRAEVVAGMDAVRRAEAVLSERFLEGAERISSLRLYGIADRTRLYERTPTFALRLGERHPRAVAKELAERGVFVWDGNYYALEIMERLGLENSGGAVRIGFCHYNTLDEVDRVLDELERLAHRGDA